MEYKHYKLIHSGKSYILRY